MTLQQSLAQFSALLSQNQFLSESIEQIPSKVEKLEARAFKTIFRLLSYQSRMAKLKELREKMRCLEEEMKKVRDEINEASIDLLVLQDEVSKSQSMLTQLIPSLRMVQKKKAAQTPLLDNNIHSLQTVLSAIRDVTNSHL